MVWHAARPGSVWPCGILLLVHLHHLSSRLRTPLRVLGTGVLGTGCGLRYPCCHVITALPRRCCKCQLAFPAHARTSSTGQWGACRCVPRQVRGGEGQGTCFQPHKAPTSPQHLNESWQTRAAAPRVRRGAAGSLVSLRTTRCESGCTAARGVLARRERAQAIENHLLTRGAACCVCHCTPCCCCQIVLLSTTLGPAMRGEGPLLAPEHL